MAQLQLQPATSGKKNRMLRHQLRIDMTPMVDLGFLLITFFIFTTTMAEDRAAKIVIPTDGSSSTTSDLTTVNAILDKDKVFFYNGKWEDAVKNNAIAVTNFNLHTGLGNYIRAKQKWLDEHYSKKRDAMVLLIKPTDASTYQNFVDALDEVTINDVKTYVVMQPTANEMKYVATH